MKFTRKIYLILLAALSFGCGNQPQSEQPRYPDLPKGLIEVDSLLRIHGQGNNMLSSFLHNQLSEADLKNQAEYLSGEIKEYREALRALNEPDYSLAKEGESAIRFLYFSSIRGLIASVAVVYSPDTSYVRVKRSQAVPIKFGLVKEYKWVLDSMVHPIDPNEIYYIQKKLHDCFFWDINGNFTYSSGFDGADWTLEGGIWGGRDFSSHYLYHKVKRWSPERGDFYEACMYLVGLCDPKQGIDMKALIR